MAFVFKLLREPLKKEGRKSNEVFVWKARVYVSEKKEVPKGK
jgi:hypothetical protein